MAGVRDSNYHVNLNGGFSGHNNPGARVWYVGATTALEGNTPSDGNSGTSPQQAFATIQKGLDSAVASRGDVVAVLPGAYAITAALTMTKADVSLVAAHMPEPYSLPNVTISTATNSVSMLEIDAANVRVEGLRFDHNTTTAAVPIIDVADTTASPGLVIRNCWIDMAGSATDTDGIRLGDGTQTVTDSLVEYCTIDSPDQVGILVSAGSDDNRIQYNRFMEGNSNTSTFMIDCGGDNCVIHGNIAQGAGTAVIGNGAAATTLNMVTDNRVWATGANTIGVLARINSDTIASLGNHILAAAAGNIVDFTTSSTTPSGSTDTGNVYAADPALAALVTATVNGS